MALTRMFGWRALEWVWGDQPQVRLKNKYGSGFRITMNTDPKLTSEAKRCDGHERPCMLRQPLTGVRRRYVRERMRRVCVCGESGRAGRWLSYIESILPAGFSLLDDFASSVTYEFPLHDGAVARVFDAMTQHAQQHGILDWGLSQTRYPGDAAVGQAPKNGDVDCCDHGRGRAVGPGGRPASRTCFCGSSARTTPRPTNTPTGL